MAVTITNLQAGPYFPNGATVAFGFGFRVLTKPELTVHRGEPGAWTVVDPALYDVVLGATEGGSVVFPTAPTSAAGPLYILGDPEFRQDAAFRSGEAPFNPKAINAELERGALRSIKLLGQIGDVSARALMAPFGDFLAPLQGARPGKVIGFGADPSVPIMLSPGGADAALREDLADPVIGPQIGGYAEFPAIHVGTVGQSLRSGEGVDCRRFGMYADRDASAPQTAANTLLFMEALVAIRGEGQGVQQEIGEGNEDIPVYRSGQIIIPTGSTLCLEPDAIVVGNDMGANIVGGGSRRLSNVSRGASVIRFRGGGTEFGFFLDRIGGRNARFAHLDICYDPGFSGALIDAHSAPGWYADDTFFGTYGIRGSGGDDPADIRQYTATAIKISQDEAFNVRRCTFDGLFRGIVVDHTRGEGDFGGALRTIERNWFFDIADVHLLVPSTRASQGLSLIGNGFNPINISPQRILDISNTVGLALDQNGFATSTLSGAPVIEWLRLDNVVGVMVANYLNDLAKAGTVRGILDIVGNRFATSDGLTVRGGVLAARSNRWFKGTNGWILAAADEPLNVSIQAERFDAAVGTSYYLPTESLNLRGEIELNLLSDFSSSGWENNASRVKMWHPSEPDFTLPVDVTGGSTVSRFYSGYVFNCTKEGAEQVVDLGAVKKGVSYTFVHLGGAGLRLTCTGANFLTGDTIAPTTLIAAPGAIGASITIEAKSGAWRAKDRSPGWSVA